MIIGWEAARFHMDYLCRTSTAREVNTFISFHHWFQLLICMWIIWIFILDAVHFFNKCMEEFTMLRCADVSADVQGTKRNLMTKDLETAEDKYLCLDIKIPLIPRVLIISDPPLHHKKAYQLIYFFQRDTYVSPEITVLVERRQMICLITHIGLKELLVPICILHNSKLIWINVTRSPPHCWVFMLASWKLIIPIVVDRSATVKILVVQYDHPLAYHIYWQRAALAEEGNYWQTADLISIHWATLLWGDNSARYAI